MLQLANFLQDMHPKIHPELRHLSESPSQIMERSANAAMTLVTAHDEMLGSIESLECVMLEGVYRGNSGNLKLSWMAARRAMLLAQVMGLHLPDESRRQNLEILDPNTTIVEPQHLWFRIVSYDLQVCRMLGLPPGAADGCSTPLESVPDIALDSLERTHCNVMTEILQRKPMGSGRPDLETTLRLDQKLQTAAKSVPSNWWLTPNLTESSKDPVTMFWDMRRLLLQMLHYDLLNQLYVPYMLGQGQSAADRQRSDLSRIACVNSSREVLSRFLVLRNSNQIATSCRIADFMVLMAAITLVLAHLGGCHYTSNDISSQADNVLSHQAPSDRAMMEQALENMRQVSRLSRDALSARSADVLRRLLDIEAKGSNRILENHICVQSQTASNSQNHQYGGTNGEDMDQVHVPYFGVIKIVRESAKSHTTTTSAKVLESNGHSMEVAAAERYVEGSAHGHNDLASQPYGHNYDPFLPGFNDEPWSFGNIDMTIFDNFLEYRPVNETEHGVE